MALDSIIIAQVNANTLALNKLNEDARKTSELPALPSIDINDLIRIEKAGVSYKALASQILPPNSEFLEYIYNKQNDLSADGTGIMYPTVDAVNAGLGIFAQTDKITDKTLKQTGIYRPDTDVSVLSISPANTLNITACDNLLFINEIFPDVPANEIINYLMDFGNKSFVANTTNTNLPANTRGVFYVGLDKLGQQVYRTAKVYDQDVCYLARIIVANTAGVYTIVSFKYFPDLANNRINNHDRFVLSSGFIVPAGAGSISFGNRGMTFYKNSINYANNKLDPNYLALADSVNPAPMQFLFLLPNITSLATSIATSTTINPTQWFTSAGAVGAGAVANTNYQVYKLWLSVTGTIFIQTKASTSNTPALGVNAIFANREDALAGLTSTVFPSLLPAGDAIALGTFYLRAGTPVNGSGLTDPNDFYFLPLTATSSSSTVGVTVHDLLSGKNDNPAFQHVTTTDIGNWNSAFASKITGLTTAGNVGASTLVGGVLNVPNYSLAGLGGINFASIIAGFVTGANTTVLNTDSLEVAIEKLQGQINAKAGSFVAQPMTKIDDTNVTLTLGGTPATSLLQAVQLTLGWTGTLADGRIASAPTWNAKQNALNGIGFVKSASGVISYDNTTYYPASNPNGYSAINGLGFVKANGAVLSYDNNAYYLASNPNGYTSNVGNVTGAGANGQVTFWTGAGSQAGDGNFTWNGTTKSLGVGGQFYASLNTVQGFYQSRKSDVIGEGVFGGSSFCIRNGNASEDLNFDVYDRISGVWRTPFTILNGGGGYFNFSLKADSYSSKDNIVIEKSVGSFDFGATGFDQNIDIILGNTDIWGTIEVTLTSSYFNANSAGGIKKIFQIGAQAGGAIHLYESRVAEISTLTSNHFSIGEVYWDGTNSRFAIRISHRNDVRNIANVSIKAVVQAGTIIANATLSGNYTQPALGQNQVNFNTNVGFGTKNPRSRITAVGDGAVVINPLNDNAGTIGTHNIWIGEKSLNTNYGLGISYMFTVETNHVGKIQAYNGGAGTTLLINPEGGNVGVGMIPSEALSVNGSISFPYSQGLKATGFTYTNIIKTGYDGVQDYVEFYTAGAGANNATAKIKIGGNDGNATFLNGIYATGFFTSSDIRLKNVTEPRHKNPELIKAMAFTWKDETKSKRTQIGYSAQEVKKYIPNAVETDKDGFLTVNYTQVLIAKIATLEGQVAELRSKFLN